MITVWHAAARAFAGPAQILASFVLHVLWQASLLACATACAIRFGRPGVRLAHALWSASLALCVLAPALSTVAARRAAEDAQHAGLVLLSYDAGAVEDLPSMVRMPPWKRLLIHHLDVRRGLEPFALTLPAHAADVVAAVYGLSLAVFALRLLNGWRRTRRLVREALPAEPSSVLHDALRRQSLSMRVLTPRLLISTDVAGPVLAGVRHPAILLPADGAADLSGAEMEAVLTHELMHLRHRDPLAHALCRLLLMPVCFHPAALWMAGRVRQTREMACDAAAAAQVGSPAGYARALLQVAERMGNARDSVADGSLLRGGLGLFETGLPLFGTGAMEERMQMLMKREVRETTLRRTARCAAVCVAVAVMVFAAGMVQVRPALAGERGQGSTGTQIAPDAANRFQAVQSEPALPIVRGEGAVQPTQSTPPTEANHSDRTHAPQPAAGAQAIASPLSGEQERMLMREMERLNSPAFQEQIRRASQIDTAKLQADLRKQLDRMNSPKFREEIERAQHVDVAKLQADIKKQLDRMNSPEFKAEMEKARSFDPAKMQQMLENAQAKRAAAMTHMQEDMQHQQEESSRLSTMNHLPVLTPDTATAADRPASEQPAKLSAGVLASLSTHKEQPKYPEEAKKNGVQGAVLLHVLVDETGRVEDVSVLQSPDQALSDASLTAVRQWTYKPYLLNGKPVAVESTVTVTYSFDKH